jgi:hypothetical protein
MQALLNKLQQAAALSPIDSGDRRKDVGGPGGVGPSDAEHSTVTACHHASHTCAPHACEAESQQREGPQLPLPWELQDVVALLQGPSIGNSSSIDVLASELFFRQLKRASSDSRVCDKLMIWIAVAAGLAVKASGVMCFEQGALMCSLWSLQNHLLDSRFAFRCHP